MSLFRPNLLSSVARAFEPKGIDLNVYLVDSYDTPKTTFAVTACSVVNRAGGYEYRDCVRQIIPMVGVMGHCSITREFGTNSTCVFAKLTATTI